MDRKEDPENLSSDSQKNASNDDGDDEFRKLLQTLAQEQPPMIWYGHRLIQYQGFWHTQHSHQSILSVQRHFQSKSSDVVLASMPKSGTTWLKALTFAIATRHEYSAHQTPLLTSNPHALVPFLEYGAGASTRQENPDHICPGIFSTHIPFQNLPESVLKSECRIIYICRNPLDMLVSRHHFSWGNKPDNENAAAEYLDEALDMFCRGVHSCGPFWDHVLGYWNAYRENPRKVLFLKYEDLKEDVGLNVEKIAEFLGLPFSAEEKRQGVIDQISCLCSFEKLSGLKVNKTGSSSFLGLTSIDNSSYFRKGEVGDWINYVTPAMAERIYKVMENKFKGSGLTFQM